MTIDLDKFLKTDMSVPKDVIELTEEEADEYDGDECYKIKGSKEVIHKKNCKHHQHTNTQTSIGSFTWHPEAQAGEVVETGNISNLGSAFPYFVQWVHDNGFHIITFPDGTYQIMRR